MPHGLAQDGTRPCFRSSVRLVMGKSLQLLQQALQQQAGNCDLPSSTFEQEQRQQGVFQVLKKVVDICVEKNVKRWHRCDSWIQLADVDGGKVSTLWWMFDIGQYSNTVSPAKHLQVGQLSDPYEKKSAELWS